MMGYFSNSQQRPPAAPAEADSDAGEASEEEEAAPRRRGGKAAAAGGRGVKGGRVEKKAGGRKAKDAAGPSDQSKVCVYVCVDYCCVCYGIEK